MRYAWDLQPQYLKESRLEQGIRGVLVKAVLDRIKAWDFRTAQQVNYFIANSHYIQARIKRAYKRDAAVIYPPVDVKSFQINDKKEDFFLTVSRMVPYKKIDIIVDAFSQAEMPLVVIGDGPDFEKTRLKAKKNIEFLGFQNNDVVKEYMGKARAFIFAAEEDFGIVPVEAQACGTPVIAFGKGGVTETVVPFTRSQHGGDNRVDAAPTGILFDEQTPSALIDAVKRFQAVEDAFNAHEIRKNAERFSTERFKKEFRAFTEERIRDFFP
jgi:glycosyltransferase involved in cell wall biosynthesis